MITSDKERQAKNARKRAFKGVRQRKWGKWVSEVRIPNGKGRIWLGSYKTAEQAARAFDAAVYCLRGPHAKFNFPNSVPTIPSPPSLSPRQIKVAAANYAVNGSSHTDSSIATDLTERAVSSSSPAVIPERRKDSSMAYEPQNEELEAAMFDSLFADSDFIESLKFMDLSFLEGMTPPIEEQGTVLY